MEHAEPGYRDVEPEEAVKAIREGSVQVLDVRTPEEYRELGHIPGALLLPVDLVASGVATLPRRGKLLLLCCEHGIRSAAAARFLARAGFSSRRKRGSSAAARSSQARVSSVWLPPRAR